MRKALMLRTCAADMSAYGGFVWPKSGPVEAPDWSADPVCGGGLHGALWGEGDGALFQWGPDSRNGVLLFPRLTRHWLCS